MADYYNKIVTFDSSGKLFHAIPWMNLTDKILSKRNETQKSTYV